MKFTKNIDKRMTVSGIVISFAAVVFFFVLNNVDQLKLWIGNLKGYFAPVTGGLMLAYVLRPFAKYMERVLLKRLKSEKLRVHISGITTVLLLFLVIYFLVRTLIPQTINSLSEFIRNFDTYIAAIKDFLAKYAEKIDFVKIDTDTMVSSSEDILKNVSTWMINNLTKFVELFYHFGNWIFNAIIIIAMALYALLDRKNIKRGIVRLEKVLLGESRTHHLNQIVERGDNITTRFLGSNLIDALIIGVINFIFLYIFKAPYAVMLAVFLGVFNYVPTFGPIIGGVIASAIMLLAKPSLFVGFAVFTVVLQQVDGNIIKPVLFGDTTGMSPFWVLVAIVVGGRMFGVIGMILGVPLFALLSSVYKEIIDKYTKKAEAKKAAETAAAEEPPNQTVQ